MKIGDLTHVVVSYAIFGLNNVLFKNLKHEVFSSPEPKAPGELLV